MKMLRNIIYILRIIAVCFICRFFINSHNRGVYLAKSLEKLGPSFIKFGQALSVRPDIIGEEIANSLSSLQDRLSPFPTLKAIRIIEKELKVPLEQIFLQFEGEAVAAASIAQVHKAVTIKGDVVAVKVLRPKIENQFKNDISLFYFIAGCINLFPSYKRLRTREVVDVFADTVKKELDLRMEAASASELYINCKNDKFFHVPKVFWEYTARKVMVLEWVDGIPINDKERLENEGHNIKEISEYLAISFLNQAFRDGFFHADIHPGNLFVDKNSNIVPVDFGIMGRLDKDTRIYVARILKGFVTGDYMQVAKVHFDAGYVAKDKSIYDFALACRAIGEPIMGLPANQVSIARLLGLLFKITEDFDMQTQPQLLLLQKTMVQIEGVGQQLYPEVNMWQMAEGWINSWVKRNLSFEGHLKAGLKDLFSVLKNLPERLKQIDEILERMSVDK